MKQTAKRCLTVLALATAAWAAGAPLHAEALNPNPNPNPNSPGLPAAVRQDPAPGRLASAAESPAPAKTRAGKRETYPFRGRIASVDTSAMTLTLEGRTTRRVINVTRDTRLERDGTTATLEALKPGDAVGGTLRKTPEGQEQATLIRVGTKPDSQPKAGTDSEPPEPAPAGNP